jgi:His-Xaa-Ser system radical SAM maturase HxsC
MALAKHTHAAVTGVRGVRLLKVLSPAEADGSLLPSDAILLWDDDAGLGACGEVMVQALKDTEVVAQGDVVRLREGSGLVSVLYRRDARGNVLFTTDRCNSLCLMCSQPPRDEADDWRVDELVRLIPLIDDDEPELGITGGEPTLLGEGLARILETCRHFLPRTHLQILTNGRRFADPSLAERLVAAGGHQATWAVPLYADGPARHDEIVGAEGAFAETLMGLAELAYLGARVEIRVVLHALSLPRLTALADFIYRRLPFVEHIALMGLEPMGLAKRNRDRLWIDPADYMAVLEAATGRLADRGLSVSIYNLPLCVLPRTLWAFARQSISDWKNIYPAECQACAVRDQCAGFFASAGPGWRSRAVAPIAPEEVAA